jgi:hypothetical protein
MVAPNRIHCTVVAVACPSNHGMLAGVKAHDLLPWADPYVAQLIKNLQDEVRHERRLQALMRRRARLSQSFPVHEPLHLGG